MAFPRFYFIGDDDLLEILGQASNPSVIQTHLKKLFAGGFPFSPSRTLSCHTQENGTPSLLGVGG